MRLSIFNGKSQWFALTQQMFLAEKFREYGRPQAVRQWTPLVQWIRYSSVL
jgi:hypothetical protein